MGHSPDLLEDAANGYPPAVRLMERFWSNVPVVTELPAAKDSHEGDLRKFDGRVYAYLAAIGWVVATD